VLHDSHIITRRSCQCHVQQQDDVTVSPTEQDGRISASLLQPLHGFDRDILAWCCYSYCCLLFRVLSYLCCWYVDAGATLLMCRSRAQAWSLMQMTWLQHMARALHQLMYCRYATAACDKQQAMIQCLQQSRMPSTTRFGVVRQRHLFCLTNDQCKRKVFPPRALAASVLG
jgi:hypothetical protein